MKLTQLQIDKMAEYGIPSHMHGGIIRYFENGIEPGHFLSAVINNDLHGAIERADDTNINCLKAYGMWFYNQAPIGSYGNANSVRDWLRRFQREKQNRMGGDAVILEEGL